MEAQRTRHWLEIAGLILLFGGIAMMVAGQLGPRDFPDPPSEPDLDGYTAQLEALQATMRRFRYLSLAGHYSFFLGGFCWIAGLIKGERFAGSPKE